MYGANGEYVTYPNKPQRNAMKSTLQVSFGLLFLCRGNKEKKKAILAMLIYCLILSI